MGDHLDMPDAHDSDFTGQVAIVTGASKGLGRTYTRWLAARGCAVVVANRLAADGTSSADKVVAEITADGGQAEAHDGPVEDEASVAEMVSRAITRFGRIDILICNAGIFQPINFADVTLAQMRKVIDINLWGTILPLKAVWSTMLAQGYGRVILSSSSAGLWGQAQSADYAVSKSALIGLARATSQDVPKGADIRINVIAPAANTAMSSDILGGQWAELMAPENVAPVVGWLANRQCDVTGAVFHVGAGRIQRIQTQLGPRVELDSGSVEQVMGSLGPISEPKNSFASSLELMPEVFKR